MYCPEGAPKKAIVVQPRPTHETAPGLPALDAQLLREFPGQGQGLLLARDPILELRVVHAIEDLLKAWA